MSKKNLLTESQVRQFMKLASLEPLARGFVEGLSPADAELDEVRTGSPPTGLGDARRGHGRGRDATDRLEEEEADPEALDDYALGDEERGHPEEAAEDELEADAEALPAPEGDERMISVTDLLSALESTLDVALDDVEDEVVVEDKAYTAKKEKPGADKRKGAEKRGAEGTLAKTKGHGKVDYVNEDEAFTSKKEKPGADKRKGAEKRGAEATKLKQDEPGGEGHKKGDDAYVNEATDELVEQITKRVAARILKTALTKK